MQNFPIKSSLIYYNVVFLGKIIAMQKTTHEADLKSIKAFEDFKESFKALLVKRYNWSVTNASNYDSPALVTTFEEGLSPQMSYYKLFDVEPDLQRG